MKPSYGTIDTGRYLSSNLALRICVARVADFEQEYLASGKQIHIELLLQRVNAPILEDAESPSLRELAGRYALSVKEIENRVIIARRPYQRLLRDEIRLYASSDEEVAGEIQDLWCFLSE